MKILVTGATGFIGSHVIEKLIFQKHEVIAMYLSKDKIKILHNNVNYVQHNLLVSSNDNLFEKFHKPDKLIHLAWSDLPNYKSRKHIENVFYHETFIKNLCSNGLKDITVIGTCQEYGKKNGELYETDESYPNTYYAIAKNILRLLIEQLDIKLKWVRLFYTYGNGQNTQAIIPQLHRAIKKESKVFNMSKGEQIRDYLPVEKVANYIVKIALQEQILGIINCCSGQPISIRGLVEKEIRKAKSEIKLNLGYYPYLDYEPFAFWGSNKKLNEILKNEF